MANEKLRQSAETSARQHHRAGEAGERAAVAAGQHGAFGVEHDDAGAGTGAYWILWKLKMRYNYKMKRSRSERAVPGAAARARRLEAQHLQRIEGNPLDADDIAMFEMFEREGWSHERRREYITARARELAPHAAE